MCGDQEMYVNERSDDEESVDPARSIESSQLDEKKFKSMEETHDIHQCVNSVQHPRKLTLQHLPLTSSFQGFLRNPPSYRSFAESKQLLFALEKKASMLLISSWSQNVTPFLTEFFKGVEPSLTVEFEIKFSIERCNTRSLYAEIVRGHTEQDAVYVGDCVRIIAELSFEFVERA